jgi:hypothetical protein
VSDATDRPLPFATRLWFAWACFFRTLFDPDFAARAWHVRDALPEAPKPARERVAPATKPDAGPVAPVAPAVAPVAPPSTDGALQLLALLQREGRLVDFLEQDIASFDDADIGAAARAVHEGSRKALRAHVTLEPVRSEEEGAKVTLQDGFDAESVKLSGNVSGKGPFKGVLRHRGWRVKDVHLPVAVKGHDVHVVCPAEVEL